MKLFIVFLFLFINISAASALADVNLPTIQIKLVDTQGAPLPGLSLRLWFRYKVWGLACRNEVPALCPGYKTESVDPIDLPSGQTQADGVATIQGADIPYKGLTAKDPVLEIDGYNVRINFIECSPQVERINNNSSLSFSGLRAIENVPSEITCTADFETLTLYRIDWDVTPKQLSVIRVCTDQR